MEKYLKKIDNKYILQEIISQTKHAKIYFGYLIDKPNNKIVIKLYNGNISILEESFNNILEKILKFNNPNIIKILDGGKGEINSINSNTKKNLYYLIEEYQNKGELFDYISLYQKGFGEKISKLLFLQILYGLNYYSLQGLFIDCIRFDNILLGDDFKIKITDVLFENIKDKISSQFNNFDLATLLFSLVTGRDPKIIGKNINKKKLDKFWLSSKLIVINQKLSKDFIDLFNKIILNNFDIISDFNLENDDFNEFNYYEKIMNHPWFEGIKIENILSNSNNCYDIVIQELNFRYCEICKKKNYNEEIITLNNPINNHKYEQMQLDLLMNTTLNGLQMPNINCMNANFEKIDENKFSNNYENNNLFYNNNFNFYDNVYYNNNNKINDNINLINNNNNININNNKNYNNNLENSILKFNLNKKTDNRTINLKDSYGSCDKKSKKNKGFDKINKKCNLHSNQDKFFRKSLNSKRLNSKIMIFHKKIRKFNEDAQCVKFKKFKNNSIKIIKLFNITSPYDFMNKVLDYCEKISKVYIKCNKFKIYCSEFKNQKELMIKISLMKVNMFNYYLIIQKIIGNNFIYTFFLSQISNKIKSF